MISVIIPIYKVEDYLDECIESVVNQTMKDLEIILVDDGSPDRCPQMCDEWAKRDSRIRVIHKPNGGLADARNAGIRASHGKYILPLDSDDLIAPTYAEKAVMYLESHPDVTLVYCRAKFFGDKNEECRLPNYDYEKLLFYNQIYCSCVYRRSDYDRTVGYNTNMKYGYEDWDFLLSLLNKNSKVFKIPEILFFYRKHGVSMISNTQKHNKELFNQIVANHLDIYAPYFYNIINGEREIRYLQNEIQKLISSRKYRLGSFLLHPVATLCRAIGTMINGVHWSKKENGNGIRGR